MISTEYKYAVVGASMDRSKYGNIVFRYLIDAGFDVVPINLTAEEVEGVKAYPSLSAVEGEIDVVVTVVPEQVTEQVVRQVQELGIKNVWMQPGSQNKSAIEFCEQNGINCRHHLCIMVQHGLQRLNE